MVSLSEGNYSQQPFIIGDYVVMDGPLENLWGGGGAGGRAKYKKKYSRKGKLNEKKSQ